MIRSKITALSVLSELWSSAIDRIEYAITSRLAILDKSADRTQRPSLIERGKPRTKSYNGRFPRST